MSQNNNMQSHMQQMSRKWRAILLWTALSMGTLMLLLGLNGGNQFVIVPLVGTRWNAQISASSSPRRVNCEAEPGKVNLTPFDQALIGKNKIFFLETSGRPSFNPRQGCAIESAARVSGLDVVVMVKNDYLDLEDNVTCQLLANLPQVHFHKFDLDNDLSNTPLEGFHKSEHLNSSKFPSTHLSDALRMVYLYKYGGWYTDVDYVFLKSIAHIKDAVVASSADGNRNHWWLTNSALHFQRPNHPFLQAFLQKIKTNFTGDARTQIGPIFFTKHFREMCQLSPKAALAKYGGECLGIDILDPDKFSPVRPGMDGKILWQPEDVQDGYWDELFDNSLAIHFFSSASNKQEVTDPKRHAYAYLAPKLCPLCWTSSPTFHGSYIH